MKQKVALWSQFFFTALCVCILYFEMIPHCSQLFAKNNSNELPFKQLGTCHINSVYFYIKIFYSL